MASLRRPGVVLAHGVAADVSGIGLVPGDAEGALGAVLVFGGAVDVP